MEDKLEEIFSLQKGLTKMMNWTDTQMTLRVELQLCALQ